MQDCGITLTSVASELLGKSGRAMIDTMLAGGRTPASWLTSPAAGSE